MSIIIKTPRIVIREFLPGEEETYLNHFIDEEVALYLPKRSLDERKTIFNNVLSKYTITKATGTWGMFDTTTGEFIGSCLLRPFDEEPGAIEVGYSMEKKYWGQGIGTKIAGAMIAHGFTDPDTMAIVAVTLIENIASQRVLEKAGLKRVGNMIRNGEELAFFRLDR